MASAWRTITKRGEKLSGLRIHDSTGRIYIRIQTHGQKQRDIRTEYFEHVTGDIGRARRERERLAAESIIARANPTPTPRVPTEALSLPPSTIAGLLEAKHAEWIAERDRPAEEIARWLRQASNVCAFFGTEAGFGHRDIHTVTTGEIREFVYWRVANIKRREEARYGTVMQGEIRLLKSAVKLGRDTGAIRNGFSLVWPTRQSFTKGREEQPDSRQKRHPIMDDDLLRRFLRELPEWISDVFRFSLQTGLRADEIDRIRFKHVKPGHEGRVVWVTPKRGRGFWCHVNPIAAAILLRAVASYGRTLKEDTRLFRPGRKYGYLPTVQRVNKRMKQDPAIKLSDMRATAGRRVYDANGADIEKAMRFLRHKSVEQTRRYLRIGDDEFFSKTSGHILDI